MTNPTEAAVANADRPFNRVEVDVWAERTAQRQLERRRRRAGMVTLACLLLAAAGGFALALLGQTPQHRLFMQPNLPRNGQAAAFFEFAPANGAGMPAACACTTPTGAKGEAMTFTRASSGTCLKAGTTTGIANGDMVTCTNDQARVMPGGDGTGGVGLLVEGVRTNNTVRSEEFDNASWTKNGVGVAAPTVTANAAVAPDGNTTAERIQFPATAAAQASQVFQSGCTLTQNAGTIFVKGNGTSGTLDFWQYAGGVTCAACSYVAGSWTRCTNVPAAPAASALFVIGNDTATCGGARSAADVFIWGAQCEAGAFASSYIATAGATVTRAAETADVALTFGAGTTGFSVAGTSVSPADNGNMRLHGVPMDGVPGAAPGASFCDSYGSIGIGFTAETTASSVTLYNTGRTVTSGVIRAATYHDGSKLNGCINGTCGAGSAAATWTAPAWTRLRIGMYDPTNGVIFGVQRGICLDGSPSRCR